MKRFHFVLLLIGLGASMAFADGALPPGSGAPSAPYQVSTLDHLLWISTNSSSWGAYFQQVADIDATATSGWNSNAGFSPIGNHTTQFTGSYDGQEHTITGLHISLSASHVGFFGYTSGAALQNINLVNVNITGGDHVGGLVGYSGSSSVTNSYATGNVSGAGDLVGGLVGYSYSNSSVTNSYATGNVSGASDVVGGLVGGNYNNSSVSNSYATGNVNGTSYVGGLVGYSGSSSVTNSYATGNISGAGWVGGLVGYSNISSVSNSYATGNVSGTSDLVGGLVGGDNSSSVSNSFWNTETSDQAASAGGTGKTTVEMKVLATFTDTTNAGLGTAWDFKGTPNHDSGSADYWDIDLTGSINSGYPYLSWQEVDSPLPVLAHQKPVAYPQNLQVVEDTTLAVTLQGTDADGDSLTFTITDPPRHGKFTGTPPSLIYTPNLDFSGWDDFTFVANDGIENSEVVAASIQVAPVNDPPLFDPVSDQTVAEDASATNVFITGVSPGGGDDESQQIVTLTAVSSDTTIMPHPTISGSGATRTLSFQPLANRSGMVTVSVTATDNGTPAGTISKIIGILINPTNDPPMAVDQNIATPEDVSVPILLAASDVDGDALTFRVVAQPANGTLSGSVPNLTYHPNHDYHGFDSFTFGVNDGKVVSNTATVSVTIVAVNDAPVAVAQSVATPENTSLSITLMGTDADGDALTYLMVGQPNHGNLTGAIPNLIYVPNAAYHGRDSFTFKVSDGQADSSVATVTIDVASVNDVPVAKGNEITTLEDTPVPVTLMGSDLDGDAVTFRVVDQPEHGTLSGSPPNLTYTPDANYYGADALSFQVSDAQADSEVAAIRFTIDAVNDAPIANAQPVTTQEDVPIRIVLSGYDVDGDSLSYTVVSQSSHGLLSGTTPDLTYTPHTDYNGMDSFAFSVGDGSSTSETATVNITVDPVNDPPRDINLSNNSVDENSESGTLVGILEVTDPDDDEHLLQLGNDAGGSFTIDGNRLIVANTELLDFEAAHEHLVRVSAADAAGATLAREFVIAVNDIQELPPPEFLLTVHKDYLTIEAGETAAYLLTLQGMYGFEGTVALFAARLPAGIDAVLSPDGVNLTSVDPHAESQLSFPVPEELTPGDYHFTVLAVSSKGQAEQIDLSLNVVVPKAVATSLLMIVHPSGSVLGAPVTVQGQLVVLTETPVPLAGLTIQLVLDSPRGDTRTFETTTDAEGNYQLNPAFRPEEVGSWAVEAQFEGNTRLERTSRKGSFTVLKASSQLNFSKETTGAIGGEVREIALPVGTQMTLVGRLTPSLADESILIRIQSPDSAAMVLAHSQTDATGAFHYTFVLYSSGQWVATIAWEGNNNYEASSASLQIQATDEPGKVILVLGGGTQEDNPAWQTFNRLAEHVHGAFVKREFDPEQDILFLSPEPLATDGADNVTSMAALEFAITQWAAERVSPQIPLYLYLLSHNLEEQFLLEKHGTYERSLTPDQLDLWLDRLPEETPVTVIVEACYSGEFVEAQVSMPGAQQHKTRTFITSANAQNQAKIDPRSLMSFTKLLFQYILQNESLSDAFRRTQDYMSQAYVFQHQSPQLESDGAEPANTPSDYALLTECYIPRPLVTLAMVPEIVEVTPEHTLPEGVSASTIQARVIGSGVSSVTATIIPPTFDPSKEFADWGEIAFDTVALVQVSEQTYEASYAGFSTSGNYTLILSAENRDGSATPVQTMVIVPTPSVPWDVNTDGIVDILDLVAVGRAFGESGVLLDADVDGSGIVDILDLVTVAQHFGESTQRGVNAAPQLPTEQQRRLLRKWSAMIQRDFEDTLGLRRGVAVLARLQMPMLPERSVLHPNYPNPFNPETWIPYYLAEDADVSLRIFDVSGRFVRQLELGHQRASAYASQEKAIHWDGRNATGEPVASGVYFYQLKAGEFQATRKMVIVR